MSINGKKAFQLYHDMTGVVSVMTDEQAGKLLKAILTYVNGSDPEFDDPVAMVAFQPIRMQLERDHQSYVNIVTRNRENGRKGGRPKKTQENPVGYLGNPNKPKKADTDTDKDKDTKETPLNPLKGKRSPKKTTLPTIPSELNKPVFTTAWQEWIQHRSELRKKLTPSTATKQLQMLLPMGADHAAAVLNHSITKGWQGLFPDDVPAPATPTQPEPAMEYFEPVGWQKFANEYAEAIRNQIFNEGEGKWENLTPAQQQDLTEKCKET